ncbi:DNA-binding transcriptional regulator [Elstera cyanobacteriorum]|uniref:DNA-binding transcriptional regulator n=1 Tax=Elstera cyanobacteriorum TaxID=2022747 RepID=A0A255XRB1_9PROT|nr:sugar-binding transcriptional regulator [Elstera cyanobacteriorum]OYQ19421.1 DNA-binding transcriptional regulator [Elstera cyanobacteriorum]GFZ91317.1 DNA-binding transcriptional regulator [Elstera cyanobacteriorum]
MASSDTDKSRLDDAARAGWLYFIAGNTQDEIAKKLNVSRPTAQRLVSLAVSERLITFRLDHPIAACLELAARLTARYGLLYCDVVPTDPDSTSSTLGIAQSTAAFIEQKLRSEKPIILAVGTGRALRAAVEQLPRLTCPLHDVVSLIGNISRDGTASFYDVLSRLADLTQARHYPMPLPIFATSPEERELLLGLDAVKKVRSLANRADVTLVGVGQIDGQAQLHVDGFITREELMDMIRMGAVGEVAGWAFNADGQILDGGTNRTLMSVPHQVPAQRLIVGVAQGSAKIEAIRAALKGRILSGLITNEATAQALLG